MRLPRNILVAAALLLSLLFTSAARADSVWNGPNGSEWNVSGSWSPTGVPGTFTVVRIGTTTSNRTVNISTATAASSTAYIGYSGGTFGTVNVIGRTWSDSSELYIGEGGGGTLNIQSSGVVTNTNGIIGDLSSSTGTVAVTGSGSRWSSSGRLHVGAQGDGTLNVQNGGVVSVTANSSIGLDATGVGQATVDGTGSQWNIGGDLYVADAGQGTLTVQNGGKVTSTTGFIGGSTGSSGNATITGFGSQWTLSNYLRVGGNGTGSLTISNGGKVSNANDVGMIGFGATGTATVTGIGSQWVNSNLSVGYNNTGTFNIQSGGVVTTGSAYVGDTSGGVGTLTVTGAGTQLADSGLLSLGDSGRGTLTIDAAGKVTSANVSLARLGSGQGTLNLNGTSGSRGVLETNYISEGAGTGGGTLNFNGGILRATGTQANFLQNFESGDVQIQSGGAFIDTNGFNVGINTALGGTTGGLTKQGAGTLTLSGDRTYYGSSAVEGGTLANAIGYLGLASGSTGSMTVSGTGSQWTNSSSLYVGGAGTGTLNVNTGASVTSAGAFLGSGTGASGTVTVTGAGSQWSSIGSSFIGGAGSGTLTADMGGTVTVAYLVIANSPSSTGTVNLNGTTGSRGILQTGYLFEGFGSGTINFNGGILRATGNETNFLQNFEAGDVQIQGGGAFVDTQTFTVGLGLALQGAGGLNKQGTGKLTLSAASTYAGATTLEAGTLEVTGSLSGAVTAQSGGTLSGTGTVAGVTLQSGAKISPGVSGTGTLHTQGETWNGGGTYVWDINAASGTPGTNWDFISLTGALNIAATSGDKFTLDINGSVSGLAFYQTYDWTIVTASGGFGGTFDASKFAVDTADFTSNTGGDFSVLTQGNNLVLHYTAVPEPGSAGLLLLGAGLCALRRRVRTAV